MSSVTWVFFKTLDIKYPKDLFSYLEKNFDFEVSIPIDIDKILEHLNIEVKYDPHLNVFSEEIGNIRIKNNKGIITLNPVQNDYIPRKRFTLAHEIGHYCLHMKEVNKFSDSLKSMSRTKSYWDTTEWEANNFAAKLLMPKVFVEREYSECKKNIEEMATRFNVSLVAIKYRLDKLGLIY